MRTENVENWNLDELTLGPAGDVWVGVRVERAWWWLFFLGRSSVWRHGEVEQDGRAERSAIGTSLTFPGRIGCDLRGRLGLDNGAAGRRPRHRKTRTRAGVGRDAFR